MCPWRHRIKQRLSAVGKEILLTWIFCVKCRKSSFFETLHLKPCRTPLTAGCPARNTAIDKAAKGSKAPWEEQRSSHAAAGYSVIIQRSTASHVNSIVSSGNPTKRIAMLIPVVVALLTWSACGSSNPTTTPTSQAKNRAFVSNTFAAICRSWTRKTTRRHSLRRRPT